MKGIPAAPRRLFESGQEAAFPTGDAAEGDD